MWPKGRERSTGKRGDGQGFLRRAVPLAGNVSGGDAVGFHEDAVLAQTDSRFKFPVCADCRGREASDGNGVLQPVPSMKAPVNRDSQRQSNRADPVVPPEKFSVRREIEPDESVK